MIANGTWPSRGNYTDPLSDDCGNVEHRIRER
jgi:hypothetical protein